MQCNHPKKMKKMNFYRNWICTIVLYKNISEFIVRCWMRWLQESVFLKEIENIYHIQSLPPQILLFTQQTHVRPSEEGNPAAFDWRDQKDQRSKYVDELTARIPPHIAYDWQQLLHRALRSAFESEQVALRDQKSIERKRKIQTEYWLHP